MNGNCFWCWNLNMNICKAKEGKWPLRQQEGYQHSRPHHCRAILGGKGKMSRMQEWGCGLRTCKDGSDMLELGVGDWGVAKHCNSKHLCVPERFGGLIVFDYYCIRGMILWVGGHWTGLEREEKSVAIVWPTWDFIKDWTRMSMKCLTINHQNIIHRV